MLNQGQMEAQIADNETPFFVVSNAPTVECAKCGGKVIAPGRLTWYDGVTRHTYCDCVTQEEVSTMARNFVAIKSLLSLTAEKMN